MEDIRLPGPQVYRRGPHQVHAVLTLHIPTPGIVVSSKLWSPRKPGKILIDRRVVNQYSSMLIAQIYVVSRGPSRKDQNLFFSPPLRSMHHTPPPLAIIFDLSHFFVEVSRICVQYRKNSLEHGIGKLMKR